MHGEKMTQAYVTETRESTYAVDIEVSGHKIKGDEPLSAGGAGLGPAPYDIFLAALGECTAMTIRWLAIQRNWPLDKVEVELSHYKDDGNNSPGRVDIFTKKIILHEDALTDDQRAKLTEIAAKCSIQRTLEATPVIHTTS